MQEQHWHRTVNPKPNREGKNSMQIESEREKQREREAEEEDRLAGLRLYKAVLIIAHMSIYGNNH